MPCCYQEKTTSRRPWLRQNCEQEAGKMCWCKISFAISCIMIVWPTLCIWTTILDILTFYWIISFLENCALGFCSHAPALVLNVMAFRTFCGLWTHWTRGYLILSCRSWAPLCLFSITIERFFFTLLLSVGISTLARSSYDDAAYTKQTYVAIKWSTMRTRNWRLRTNTSGTDVWCNTALLYASGQTATTCNRWDVDCTQNKGIQCNFDSFFFRLWTSLRRKLWWRKKSSI